MNEAKAINLVSLSRGEPELAATLLLDDPDIRDASPAERVEFLSGVVLLSAVLSPSPPEGRGHSAVTLLHHLCLRLSEEERSLMDGDLREWGARVEQAENIHHAFRLPPRSPYACD